MKDEVKKVAEQLLKQAQDAVVQDVTIQLFEDKAKLLERAAQVATDTIERVNKLAADGDPDKQEIAAIVRRSVLGGLGQVGTERTQPQGERVPLEENPFSGNSSKSVTDSRGSQKALPNEPPRGRGRPPGSKNQSKS